MVKDTFRAPWRNHFLANALGLLRTEVPTTLPPATLPTPPPPLSASRVPSLTSCSPLNSDLGRGCRHTAQSSTSGLRRRGRWPRHQPVQARAPRQARLGVRARGEEAPEGWLRRQPRSAGAGALHRRTLALPAGDYPGEDNSKFMSLSTTLPTNFRFSLPMLQSTALPSNLVTPLPTALPTPVPTMTTPPPSAFLSELVKDTLQT